MAEQFIRHFVGDTKIVQIPVYSDAAGTQPVDLTGASARFVVARAPNSTGADVLIEKTSPNGVTITQSNNLWTVNVTLQPSDTIGLEPLGPCPDRFYFACAVTDASGNVATVANGIYVLQGTPNPGA